LVWTPIGWIKASEVMVVRPYRASDPNARPETPQWQGQSSWGLTVTVLDMKGETKGVRHFRHISISRYTPHAKDGPGLGQSKMRA